MDEAALWQALTEGVSDSIVVVDADGVYRFVNHVLPGLSREDLVDRSTPFDFVEPADAEVIRKALATSVRTAMPTRYEVFLPSSSIWVETQVIPVARGDGDVRHLILTTHDLSELKRREQELQTANEELRRHRDQLDELVAQRTASLNLANARLERLAELDDLTMLLNRRAILGRMRTEMDRITRYEGVLSLVLVDLDLFKRVNDTYGHMAGDRVLAKAAALFTKQVRGVDAVGRYGGEEFLFILPGTQLEGAMSLAERVRAELELASWTYDGNELTVTCSAGVATTGVGDQDPDDLLRAADRALYRAKALGRRNCVVSATDLPPED